MFHATPFYNSKISIRNGSTGPFGEDDFCLREAGQSLEIIKHLEAIVKYFENFCSDFDLGGQRFH